MRLPRKEAAGDGAFALIRWLSWGMRRMAKKYYFLAVVALLLIPVASMLGGTLAIAINPEFAAGHANYVRNYRLLAQAKTFVMLATAFVDCGLWLACCVFLLKAKERSYWWLPLAILGPFGLAALAVLKNRAPGNNDLYQRFIGGMKPLVRVAYEIVVFVVVWIFAFQAMVLWRDLMIMRESLSTGVPVAAIIDLQNASSGMWAFSEGLEVLFLVALIYLMRPVCFNAVAFFGKSFVSSRQA